MTLVRSHERTVHRDNGKVIKSEGEKLQLVQSIPRISIKHGFYCIFHFKGMTQINKFICADCGIEKGSEQAMTRHRKYYHDGDPVPCKECNKTFPSQVNYNCSTCYKVSPCVKKLLSRGCTKT